MEWLQSYPTLLIHKEKKEKVLERVQKIISEGAENLYFISDYDATMTKRHLKETPEKRLPTSYGVLENYSGLPEETKDFVRKNVEKYYPQEMDTSLSEEEKFPIMVEWYTSSMDAILKTGMITVDRVKKAVQDSPAELRDNCDKVIKMATANKIPYLIFSAGMGDIIDLTLKHKDPICWSDENMIIVANLMDRSEEPVKKFLDPLIHSCNKENLFEHCEKLKNEEAQRVVQTAKQRKNMILMGDHKGDLKMKNGISAENILTIGFLNDHFENEEKYLQDFDIVLKDETTFDFQVKLLQKIIERDDC